ncbi:uncharacterized protein B0H18DRAFT_956619 [Fomitopsis serialis]|uniref:uncharacterized protein n=1 Tax=Fomitopsis serialis TaxID=139415 RepID=UPI00200765DC|nr:uncharacterized protein B0H18DRAFT_956619 [Neoantrodia serialis]KAH9921402.1 hypothetical protein B0H18DRAFT_956619 [Neoantrodia serialis]
MATPQPSNKKAVQHSASRRTKRGDNGLVFVVPHAALIGPRVSLLLSASLARPAFTKTGEPPGGWGEEEQDQDAREEDPADEDEGDQSGEEDEGEAQSENEDDEE